MLKYILALCVFSWNFAVLAGEPEAFLGIPYSVSNEVDLIRSFLGSGVFDAELCKSLKLQKKSAVQISYLQASFVFFYPKQEAVQPSYAEMGTLDHILYENGRIVRREQAGKIPLDYVRVFDPTRKRVTAEVSVLVVIIPTESVEKRRIERRLFKFQYYEAEGSWRA
jgi:hypothetical protein